MRDEFAELSRAGDFDVLKQFIPLGAERGARQTAAGQLGMSVGAFDVAVHRFRRRYRELIRAEIGRTVASVEEIDDEVRLLFETLGR